MEHIDWLNKSNINLLRINLKNDTFLSDVDLYETRLILFKNQYFIRYKKSNKIYWYLTSIHKISGSCYYLTIDTINDEKIRNRLNRKYIIFNRDYSLNLLLN